MNKPTIPEVLPLIMEYYKHNSAGGSLHVVLDDGNIKDSDVLFCLYYAKRCNDDEGIKIARLLLNMSKTQRKKLYIMKK